MRFIDSIILYIRQALVNREYKRDGLTDSVFEKQLAINKARHRLNISDPTVPRNDEGFVQ